MWEDFVVCVPADADDVLWVQVCAILQAADQEQEYILPHRLHFNLINILPFTDKETPHILKHINKDKPKYLHHRTNTIFKITQLLPYTTIMILLDASLLKL